MSRCREQSIRRAFLLLSIGLSVCAFVLAVILGGSVARLAVLSNEFERSVHGLRAVEELEVSLLSATRAHQLLGETGEERWRREMVDSDAELGRALGEAERLVETPGERELVGRLTKQVENIRSEVLAVSPATRTIQRAEVFAALDDAGALSELTKHQSELAVERTRQWSRIAAFAAVSALFFTAASLFSAVRYARRTVYLPVKRLRHSLELSANDNELRVPEEGPVEVRQIAGGVNRLLDRLEARREQLLTFLSAIAHDLRTPMSSLRMAAELGCSPADPEKQQRRTKLILRQVDRMNRMVQDLLDVGRIEAGHFDLQLEKKDLREIVRDTAALFAETSKAHEVRSELPEESVMVEHDPARLAQVLSNLVSNAIKYSPEGGPVDLRVRVQEARVAVEVEDRGLGVLPEERETIFEPFRRSSGNTLLSEIPGVGLGLSVARRLVRAHGGEIEVDGRSGPGSTFRVLLPIG